MERDAELEAHLSRIAREWVSTVLLLGAFLFLLLGGMDFLTVPEQAPRFFRYRIGIAVTLFVLHALNRLRTSKYYQYFIVTATTTASAVMIELMVLSFGGQRSTYYAGFNLVVMLRTRDHPHQPRAFRGPASSSTASTSRSS